MEGLQNETDDELWKRNGIRSPVRPELPIRAHVWYSWTFGVLRNKNLRLAFEIGANKLNTLSVDQCRNQMVQYVNSKRSELLGKYNIFPLRHRNHEVQKSQAERGLVVRAPLTSRFLFQIM